jgi:hypothetical protein
MEKKTIWQCHNPECNAQYTEYVNGCPKCATGEPEGSHKVSILDEHHPGYMPLYTPPNNMENKYPIGIKKSKENFQDIIVKVCKKHGIRSLELTTKHISLMADCIQEYIDTQHQPPAEAERVNLTPEQIEERKEAIEWYRNPAGDAETGNQSSLAVREKAEQWFKEEVGKIDDERRKEEVLLEDETYIGVWMQGYKANEQAAPQGAVWVTGQYDRLYDQLKAEPERKIVCWVDYTWRWGNEPPETLRDICAIMGRIMGFNARGTGYGGAEGWVGNENEKLEFLSECKRLHVQWLDESAGEKDGVLSFTEWAAVLYRFKEGKWEDDDGHFFTTAQLWDKYQKEVSL